MFASKRLRATAGATIFLAGFTWLAQSPVTAQAPDFSKADFRTEKLGDNFFVLFGGGGNIAVITGPDGALVVDSDVIELSPKLRAALTLVTEKPARFLLNTHFHFDHAGGNAALGRGGTVIVAHDNVRKHLQTRQVVNLGGDIVIATEPTEPAGLPVVTFADGLKFHVNGDVVAAYHVSNAHTDSDAFVYFEKANVLHTGDLFMSIGYPFVDGGNGGTLDGLIAAHARALKLCNEQTRIIPGHGPVTDRATLQAYHDMLVTIRQRVADMARRGRTLEQVRAAQPTKEFDERWGKGYIKPELFLERVYIGVMRGRKGQ